MRSENIVFTDVNTVDLLEQELLELGDDEIRVSTRVSTISSGTEKANLIGDPNVNGMGEPGISYPRRVGYASAGTIVEMGKNVTGFNIGDRVIAYWGTHSQINQVNKAHVVKMLDEITFNQGALVFIGTFPLAAVRKCRVEAGESAIVMGLGVLGQLAVMFCKVQGATPVIAVDPVKERRERALMLGADYALDPTEEGFKEKVRALTGGGANVAIEVTGLGKGLEQALDCMARFGRVALLGCTRNSDFTIDYYRKVHAPGITIIGAHTNARPDFDSHSGWFTHNDDIKAIMRLQKYRRIDLDKLVGEIHSPKECKEVYSRLINDKKFPVVQFDWSKL
jgi:2-desacetyl-2-hydroxyethyl bacteriochlorophyllide A dehydrogenase